MIIQSYDCRNREVIALRELQVSANDSDQRVDKFLMKALPLLPKSLMYKYIRNKKIKVNHARCEISRRLQCGDTIQCYIREEFFAQGRKDLAFLAVSKELKVLYEDENILVAYKAAGVLSQKDQSGIQDNMNDRLLHYLYDQHGYDPEAEHSFVPAFAHRLDRNTEGIMIAGKNALALRTLNECFKTHKLRKYYLTLVEGHMERAADDLKLYHKKNHRLNRAELYDTMIQGAVPVYTSYRVMKEWQNDSLLEVELHSGKSHQIRATFAKLNHPLLGDQKYHATLHWDHPHQALCAYRLAFGEDGLGCFTYLARREFILSEGDLPAYLRAHGFSL